MWLREVVKFLRFAGDVLAEYVAGEQTKHNAARQAAAASKRSAEEAARRDAEEVAQRRAAEVAAREAEQRSARERQAKQTTLRRRQRRRGRQAMPVTIPVETSPELAARMAATPSSVEVPTTPTIAKPAAAPTDVISSLMAGLPPIVVETITQLQVLDGAIRGLLTSTDRMRAWFERVQAHPRWGHVVVGISMVLPMIVQRISSSLYFRTLQEAHDHRRIENYIRMDRMIEGDWREKVRYLHWTNGQRRARALRAAVSAGLLPREAVPA